MHSLIFFALVAVCAARPQGFLADTPEVVAERARFIQLYNAAAAAAAAAPDVDVHYNPNADHRFTPNRPAPTFQQTFQQTFQHQQAPQFVPQFAPRTPPAQAPYNGPFASTIPAGVDGTVTPVGNTAEVEAAIADFTRAYNAAVVATTGQQTHHVHHSRSGRQQGYGPPNTQRSGRQLDYNAPNTQSSIPQAPEVIPVWTGPLASSIPAGLPGSPAQVQETADVQAAKAAFARAFQQQLAYSG